MAKPPRAAYRPTGWPVLRTPRWMLAAGLVLVAGLVLAAIPHRPSTAQRAADLRGVVHDLNNDIESCAGGVTDSLTALRAIESGTSQDVETAVTIDPRRPGAPLGAEREAKPHNDEQLPDAMAEELTTGGRP